MKKQILVIMLAVICAHAVVPSVGVAASDVQQVQMSREEKSQKLKAARESLDLLQEQLHKAERADDGRLVVKIRNGSLIAAGLLGGATVLGLMSMSGGAPGNTNAYRYGVPTLGAALGAVASLVVAGTSQGILMFSDSEVEKVEARIKSTREAISNIEASLE